MHWSANGASYRHFYLDRLPEAICSCLQTYTVYNNVLHVFTGFLFSSLVLIKASYGYRRTYMLFTNILPEAICCCLETCNVYVTSFCIIMCTNFHGHYC